MFDKNAVLAQAQSGSVPPEWRLLRANRTYFYQSAVVGFVIAILAVAAAAYLFVTGTVVGYAVVNDSTAGFWQIVDVVVLLLFLVGGIAYAVQRLSSLGSVEQQMLVITPEGFVMRTGPAEKNVRQVSFSAVKALKTSIQSGTVYIVVQPMSSAKSVKVELDKRFGKPKAVATQIAGMYAQYATARVQR